MDNAMWILFIIGGFLMQIGVFISEWKTRFKDESK